MSLSPIDTTSTDVSVILDQARSMVAEGAILRAVDWVTKANRTLRAPELERQLVTWRTAAFAALDAARPRVVWPPEYADPFPGHPGLPQVEAEALTAEILGGAILHHGALWVRGLASAGEAERLRQDIDRAFAARDAFHAGAPLDETNPWYAQAVTEETLASRRGWVESGGGAWTADSPRVLFDLVELFNGKGIVDVIAGVLGERPALSIGKSTLRRVPCTTNTDWHQDGSFLGPSVRTVNVWLSLSDCGEDAPGLDVVARRLPYVVQCGSHGAYFDWSVGPGMVGILEQGGAEVVSPVFAAGDALLFDQLMLHRTGVRPGMTKSRWAVESWFFAPSSFPMEQAPIVV
ncbi:MAG TPA: phytanoyl-CoA dioxygenase family protein [Aliidongia sp.]|uniref:phytanoyl-CoA dioxygenase family protein n=1 Tax=Aliidongia sp. TaxID=1914230 RepID=UPI002DDCC580|nr:phytanoyl-CoA dioxygenase family protein [Aliidongia sp.]HEV2677622.1 phytanoyl-CoA dioxygenase family protein [Aliidongia sp.]